MDGVRLKAAGWMGNRDRAYFEAEVAKLRQAGLESAFEYAGVLDHVQKIDFLTQLDVLSVPTVYRDPKGIFVLEALASGVPVVQPEHGAFPELLAATGGGRLFRPEDPRHLADVLYELLTDADLRHRLASDAHRTVHQKFGADLMADQTLEVYRKFLGTTSNQR
jgi:glycosyltransferase involved in cell wall biosynthesis